MDDLITAVAEAIEDETERTIGEPSGIGDLLARAAMRAAAEHFEREADKAPTGATRTIFLAVADQVRPPA